MPNRTPRDKGRSQSAAHAQPPTVSPRWLITTLGIIFAAALLLGWVALCFVFWQGSWQLLYHPTKAITRTPASVHLSFDDLGFATTEAGQPRLHGWWIPAPNAPYTALYLHGVNGNLSNTVEALATLHAAGLNVLAFDYRGYGQSQLAHPSEAHWREDATWALNYLTGTRNIPLSSVVLVGDALGASLALEVAAAHPGLAGVVLNRPDTDPLAPIFNDPRAHLVPAHLLVRDHWKLADSAAQLRIPLLWFQEADTRSAIPEPELFKSITASKTLTRLTPARDMQADYVDSLTRWLGNLSVANK